MIEAAREASKNPRTYWTDQLNNNHSIEGYISLGEEILQQANTRLDAFVHSVGTGASILGVARALKRRDRNISIVAVEPAESAVLSRGPSGAHKIEGIGIGYRPPMWSPSEIDRVVTVSTCAAQSMARRLAAEEGLFAGTSSGANVVAAIEEAERLGPSSSVVTILVDSGLKYLSTDLYGIPSEAAVSFGSSD